MADAARGRLFCVEEGRRAFAALRPSNRGLRFYPVSAREPASNRAFAMPVIINSQEIHPFLPSLGSPLAIERKRAEHQDIRPLEIAIINLMADKISTERQLALWLGNTTLQVNLSFVATDSYVRGVESGGSRGTRLPITFSSSTAPSATSMPRNSTASSSPGSTR